METVRRLPMLFACGVLFLQLLPALAIAQEGRPVAGREMRRAAEKVGRHDERRNVDQRTERQSEDRRGPQEKRAEEARRAEIDTVAAKIDLTREYNQDKLDFDALAKKIEADERRRAEAKEEGMTTAGFDGREGRPREVVPREAVDRDSFRRLNGVDQGPYKVLPHQAGAAAEFEKYWGSTLKASPDGSVDYVITKGRDVGKTVDFMLTETVERPNEVNKSLKAQEFEAALRKHIYKADLIPIETRFLTEVNRSLVTKEVEKLAPEAQQKIIIIKRE